MVRAGRHAQAHVAPRLCLELMPRAWLRRQRSRHEGGYVNYAVSQSEPVHSWDIGLDERQLPRSAV